MAFRKGNPGRFLREAKGPRGLYLLADIFPTARVTRYRISLTRFARFHRSSQASCDPCSCPCTSTCQPLLQRPCAGQGPPASPAACRLHSLSRPASRTRRTSRVARNFTPTSSSQYRSRVFVPDRWPFHGLLACLSIYLTVLLHDRPGPAVRLYCIWRLCTWLLQDLKCVHAPWGFHDVQPIRRYGSSPALDMNNTCEHQSPRFSRAETRRHISGFDVESVWIGSRHIALRFG